MINRPDNSRWILWALAHPFLSTTTSVLVLLGMFVGLAMYLDQRIASSIKDQVFGRPADEPTGAFESELPMEVNAGQSIYVPLYSHILVGDGRRLNLAATMSIRNTDSKRSLTIRSARYYDTEGNLIREYVEVPLELKPMGSTDFFVRQSDTLGGAGANFVVEWVAAGAVHEPIAEAVMVGRDGSGYAAFTSRGRSLNRMARSFTEADSPFHVSSRLWVS